MLMFSKNSNEQFLQKWPVNSVSQVSLSHGHLVQLRRSNKIWPALLHSWVTYSCLLISSASWLPLSCLPGRNRPVTSLAWEIRVQPGCILQRKGPENDNWEGRTKRTSSCFAGTRIQCEGDDCKMQTCVPYWEQELLYGTIIEPPIWFQESGLNGGGID